MSAGRWSAAGKTARCRDPPDSTSHDSPKPDGRQTRIAPAGLMFLAITSIGWGFNWPITKHLLSELPPLTVRGTTGVIGAAAAGAARGHRAGESLRVARELWPRLVLAAVLNVTAWMVLMGLALLWLPASEAALIAYTMPVWASHAGVAHSRRTADVAAGDLRW